MSNRKKVVDFLSGRKAYHSTIIQGTGLSHSATCNLLARLESSGVVGHELVPLDRPKYGRDTQKLYFLTGQADPVGPRPRRVADFSQPPAWLAHDPKWRRTLERLRKSQRELIGYGFEVIEPKQ